MSLTGVKIKHYYKKNEWVLNNISISVKSGQVLGLEGESGCGKTTLMKILAGYIKPKSGSVIVDGKELGVGGFRPVQWICQHPEKAVNPLWYIKDILTESYNPSKEILDTFGIKKEWLKRRPIELSGGELQRCCIVRALNPNTKYIIADEMTTMLDGVNQVEIWSEFLNICSQRGIGIIVVSHERDILNKLCNEIVKI